jgi:hypothetical protein
MIEHIAQGATIAAVAAGGAVAAAIALGLAVILVLTVVSIIDAGYRSDANQDWSEILWLFVGLGIVALVGVGIGNLYLFLGCGFIVAAIVAAFVFGYVLRIVIDISKGFWNIVTAPFRWIAGK